MSGITGIVSQQRKLTADNENIKKMTDSLTHRGKAAKKIILSEYGFFGCTNMICSENIEKQLPLSFNVNGTEYIVCFDGLIYNSDVIKNELTNRFTTEHLSDAELVFNLYLRYGAGCLKKINGIFAFTIWNSENKELFMARDRFGIKPLYYAFAYDSLYFASEIKSLLTSSNIEAIVDKNGLCEVLALGPAHTPGSGVFCGIQEILPAHFAIYNKNGFKTSKYWQLNSKPFTGTFEECLEETKSKVFSAINSQLEQKERKMAFFLSGGLDSSAITALAVKKFGCGINTFSLLYSDNDQYFSPTEYQPDSDDFFVDIMQKNFDTKHHIVSVQNEDLINYLTFAVDARDLPGMADVDSSLYFLCKQIGAEFNGAISGECADEVFGGYPWFHRKEDLNAGNFPWAKNTSLRENFVSPDIFKPKEISDYILDAYQKSIKEVPYSATDNPEEKAKREIAYLNIKWFMYSLGARSERIGMHNGLEIRMPFCDYELVEYIWNIPWEYKNYNDREKGLLRKTFEGILPNDVLWRKKSPFPKTHNPEFEKIVKDYISEIFDNKNSLVCDIINVDYVHKLMEQSSDYGKPWFGQLMAMPQLYAYIFQIDYWLKKYNIKIRI